MSTDKAGHYLQPWSVISDAELSRLRKLETIARSRIRHLLQDPQCLGWEGFSRAELEWLIR